MIAEISVRSAAFGARVGCIGGALSLLLAAGCLSDGAVTSKPAAPLTAETVCEFAREEGPEGLSALSRIKGTRYYSVDDRGGMLHELEIAEDDAGESGTFRVVRSIRLEGRTDLEGCAYDPLDGRVWVSDEADSSVRQYDPATGRQTAQVKMPEIFRKNIVKNRSFEGLALSPDGLRLYVANEDTLRCDGPVADSLHGGLVRIQEFVREGAGRPWTPKRQLFYPTDTIEGEQYRGLAVSGVAALCVTDDGALLVLEREMSCKNPLFPSFRARLYEVSAADAGRPVGKRLVWEEDTMFSNYEGLSLGPMRKDGTRTAFLISDGGGEAEKNVLVLSLR